MSLTTGKPTAKLVVPFGEVAAMGGAPDGQGFVTALRGDERKTTVLRTFNLDGVPRADIAIDALALVKQVIPFWDPLVAVLGGNGVVVDLKARAACATYTGSAKEARHADGRFVLSTWGGDQLELTSGS